MAYRYLLALLVLSAAAACAGNDVVGDPYSWVGKDVTVILNNRMIDPLAKKNYFNIKHRDTHRTMPWHYHIDEVYPGGKTGEKSDNENDDLWFKVSFVNPKTKRDSEYKFPVAAVFSIRADEAIADDVAAAKNLRGAEKGKVGKDEAVVEEEERNVVEDMRKLKEDEERLKVGKIALDKDRAVDGEDAVIDDGVVKGDLARKDMDDAAARDEIGLDKDDIRPVEIDHDKNFLKMRKEIGQKRGIEEPNLVAPAPIVKPDEAHAEDDYNPLEVDGDLPAVKPPPVVADGDDDVVDGAKDKNALPAPIVKPDEAHAEDDYNPLRVDGDLPAVKNGPPLVDDGADDVNDIKPDGAVDDFLKSVLVGKGKGPKENVLFWLNHDVTVVLDRNERDFTRKGMEVNYKSTPPSGGYWAYHIDEVKMADKEGTPNGKEKEPWYGVSYKKSNGEVGHWAIPVRAIYSILDK